MLLSYDDALKMYGNNYALKKQIVAGMLFKFEKGLYSSTATVPELARITYRYPNAIFTVESAFYFYSLTDVIPEYFVLATPRTATRITDQRIKQVFVSERLFSLGQTTTIYNGVSIRIYDKERLLIELLRNKSKFPYDYYKEILAAYRKGIAQLDLTKVYGYLDAFAYKGKYIDMLETEVL